MPSDGKGGYSAIQILLHWLIALLVLFQLLFGESIGMVLRAERRGTVPDPSDVTLANFHYWVGITILVLVMLRILMRLSFGAPPSAGGSAMSELAAKVTHGLFYLLLVVTPVTGLLAFYAGEPFGDIHELAKPVFIVLIVLHALAALWHQFWLKDGTLRRMVVPG